jgi:hypothetical protein
VAQQYVLEEASRPTTQQKTSMSNVFLEVVAPVLGNVLAVVMLVSPTPAVLAARRSKDLGVGSVVRCMNAAKAPYILILASHIPDHEFCNMYPRAFCPVSHAKLR